MKKFILLFVLLIPLYSRAEYNEWNFKIAIKTIEGKELIGYGTTLEAYEVNPDSLDKDYLIKILTQGEDIFFIYLNRIAYTNTSDKAPMHSTEYVLLNRISISSASIQSLKISDWEMGSTLSGIDNEVTLADTSWLNTKPIKIVHVNANSCEYDIFFHEKSKKLDALIQKFIEVAKEHENSEEAPIDAAEMEEHRELIKKMKGLKVVVMSFCTC